MKTLRVKLRKTSAGPDGVWQAGNIVALPVDEAKRLIEAGAAIDAGVEEKPEKPSELAPLRTKDSGPFSDDEWALGITLEHWAQWRSPDAFAQREANRRASLVTTADEETFEERTRAESRREADATLRGQLRADLASGVLVLGVLPDTLYDDARQVSPDALPEVLEWISGGYNTFDPVYQNKQIELRLYKAERFTESGRTTGKDETGGFAGEARAGDGDRAPKGKRGRKPIWKWEGATREMMRLANSLDGLPTKQADLERAIIDWFARNNNGQSPAESLIREFVVKRLPPDYRDG